MKLLKEKEILGSADNLNNVSFYKIKGDVIVVTTGLFKRVKVKNTRENINSLNRKLERDHRRVNVNRLSRKANKYAKRCFNFALLGIATAVASAVTAISFLTTVTNVIVLFNVYNLVRCLINDIKITKYNKVELLLKQNKEVPIYPEQDNSFDLAKEELNGKTKENNKAKENQVSSDEFDFSKISNYSLEKLKELRRSINDILNSKPIEAEFECVDDDTPTLKKGI